MQRRFDQYFEYFYSAARTAALTIRNGLIPKHFSLLAQLSLALRGFGTSLRISRGRTAVATKLLIAFIASMALGAQAVPVVFTSAQFDTSALAIAEGVPVFDSHGPTPTTSQSNATSFGANDFASGSALGSSGLLTAFAEADSLVGAASALAQSHFLGSFSGSGRLSLHLGFDTTNALVGGGLADAMLFVLVQNTVGGVTTTLFNTFFASGTNIDLLAILPTGGTTTLDLLLFSEASTTGGGQSGQNFSELTFAAAIPLPATLLLLIAGLGAMLAVRRKSGSARA